MTGTSSHDDEESVLLAFAVEADGSPGRLAQWVERHPEHADALVALAVDLALLPAREAALPTEGASAAVEAAWARFSAGVAGLAKPAVPAPDPFAGLDMPAFRTLASALGMPIMLLIRLRDRLVEVTTIPSRFLARLAAEVKWAPSDLVAYLDGSPAVPAGTSFKADEKPVIPPKQSWAAAVEASRPDPEQRQQLLEA